MKRFWILLAVCLLCCIVGSALAADTITVNTKKVTLEPADKYTLQIEKVCTCDVPHKSNKFTCTSSDTSVAIVNSKGRITAKKEGTCVITLAWHGVTETVQVTVKRTPVTYRALLVGNSEYTTLSRLVAASNDIVAMKQLLKIAATPYKIATAANRSANGIVRAIKNTFADADSNDISLFYYAGHGSADGSLCGVDGSKLSTKKLHEALNAIPGKVIVILDTCYAGHVIAEVDEDGHLVGSVASAAGAGDFGAAIVRAFRNDTVEDAWSNVLPSSGELRTNKYTVLTSSTWAEESWNIRGNLYGQQFGPKWASLMTRFLTLGAGWDMQEDVRVKAEADADKNKTLTLKEVKQYAQKNVDFWMKYVSFDQSGLMDTYEQTLCCWPANGKAVLLQLK